MPSFDVVNKVDMQEVSNAVNNANKEVTQRCDFRGSNTEIIFDSKTCLITVQTEDEMKMEAVKDMLLTHAIRRKVKAESLDFKDVEPSGGKTLRREVHIKEGIDKEIARTIVKDIKSNKIKVQVSIQGDELRVSGKKRDDLQEVMQMVREGEYGIPLQFTNRRD